ncbi:MAG: GDSL-type esterase/lipase family protein [Coxiellaceae bacterium]|nr:GDSL-type esterase/lipase family protein [Coxiellaceae bacterium]
MTDKKRILCFGDSNTWGFMPGSIDRETLALQRYSSAVRWTGQLQSQLGDDYAVIEEGLNGRTTDAVYQRLPYARDALSQINPIIYSQAPLDLVIIMLGINDLKIEFKRDAQAIAQGLANVIDVALASPYGHDMCSAPPLLVVAPPPLSNESFLDLEDQAVFKGTQQYSQRFDAVMRPVAEAKGCHYYNAGEDIELSEIDGIHFDEAAHTIFANKIAEHILSLLG